MLLLENKDIMINIISEKEKVDKWILNVLRYKKYK